MVQQPDPAKIEERDDAIDPSWAAIVFDRFNRHAARRWLSAQAFAAGLSEDDSLPAPGEPPKAPGTVTIDQTLSFKLNDPQCTTDGQVTVRQSFELSSECRSADADAPRQPAITQTPRVLWLRGPEALGRSRVLVKKLKERFGPIAAAMPVHEVKGQKHWYAIDPWLVELRIAPQAKLPAKVRDVLERPWTPAVDGCDDDRRDAARRIDDGVRLYGGQWLAAQLKSPMEDSREFSRWFYQQASVKEVLLSYRTLPLTVRAAGVPNADSLYTVGPSASPGQNQTLDMIGAPLMWDKVDAVPATQRKKVHVFLFDIGVESFGSDIQVHEEHSANAVAQPPVIPLPMGEFHGIGGDPHGRYMASIMGAHWAAVPATSMAGVFGKWFEEVSIVSIRCQSLAEMTNGLAHLSYFMSSRPLEKAVAVFGNDLLHACRTSYVEGGIKPEVERFKAALAEAQATGAGKADLLVVIPAGNWTDPADTAIPSDLEPRSAATVVVGACGLFPGDALWAGSRFAPPSGGTKPCLVAPGQSIIAAASQTTYHHVHGTSYAAAHVAGVAALLRMIDTGNRTASQIGDVLRNTCSSIGALRLTVPDGRFGRGRLNGAVAASSV